MAREEFDVPILLVELPHGILPVPVDYEFDVPEFILDSLDMLLEFSV
jgi:hypothetical protein